MEAEAEAEAGTEAVKVMVSAGMVQTVVRDGQACDVAVIWWQRRFNCVRL